MLKRSSVLPELKLISSNFAKKRKKIWDICIYGSFVRGKIKSNDIDIAIILKEPLCVNKKLEIAQELRSHLKELEHEFDVKCVDIKDFIDPSFMAGAGIIGEGFLLVKGRKLSEVLGFKSYAIFTYNLKNLTNSEKVMFNYSLNGRRGESGLLDITNSEHIGSGVLKTPVEKSEEFKEFFEKHKIDFKMSKSLFY
ncbi:MAG: nucleotidyltransferase domain-containing protein [Candidatus Aenigmarchaeota archaeon]|nr:nucleotidyltransferase domain-containing protein [Candidatus Aenigmarchaeota archaeon]